MANPYQQSSSDLQESDSPSSSSGFLPRPYSYASAAGGTYNQSTASSHMSRPARASIISQLLNNDELGTGHFGDYSRLDGQQNGSGLFVRDAPWALSNTAYPPMSKAFGKYLRNSGLMYDADSQDGTRFFVPSYLQGSTYVQQLEEAHRLKLQKQKETQNPQNPAAPSLTTSASSTNLQSKPTSHRGISHHVVEKPPPEDEEALPPLPTRWNKDDKYPSLEVVSDGLDVKYTGSKGSSERDHEAYSIRSDHYMPAQCGIYYFEVAILGGKRDDTTIGIGFSAKSVALSRPPGWEPDSYGYHGDDGNCYAAHSGGKAYGPPFTVHDVIGCGINFRTKTAFYTKNGVFLGTAFKDVKGKLYPSVGLKKAGEHVRVNFGQTPFVFDIDAMMNREKTRILAEITQTSTSKLSPLKERDLVQSLVLQFLQHDGYIETARAFAEEIHSEKRALSLDPNAVIEDINVRDDEHATKRQRIRRAVLEGDIDRALKHTNAFYPEVLQYYEHVNFKLRCRKFIEMVRQAAEMRIALEGKKSNGHATNDYHTQDMDLDLNGAENGTSYDRMDTEDGAKKLSGIEELELETLMYGQSLQAEYKDNQRREVTEALENIYALLAYTNPLKEKDVSHLLDKKGRVAVAEELNSAILMSLGKSSRAALDEVYAQTTVLLDDLRENGGPGSFVSLQDVIDDIPKAPLY